jgi:tetratricopeptide (TPR) repeat protein
MNQISRLHKTAISIVCVLAIAIMIFHGCTDKTVVRAFPNSLSRQLLVEGRVFLKHGNVEKAVESFGRAINTAPDYFEPYVTLANTLTYLKQFDSAQAVLAMAGSRFPDNPFVYYTSATIYRQSGQLMPAIMAARKSFEICQRVNDKV